MTDNSITQSIVVRPNNLFVNGTVYDFPAEAEQLLLREPLPIAGASSDKYYTVRQDDRIDVIAYRFYSPIVFDASKYWWVIADANIIQEPLDLSDFVGQQILIPNILNALLLL